MIELTPNNEINSPAFCLRRYIINDERDGPSRPSACLLILVELAEPAKASDSPDFYFVRVVALS